MYVAVHEGVQHVRVHGSRFEVTFDQVRLPGVVLVHGPLRDLERLGVLLHLVPERPP